MRTPAAPYLTTSPSPAPPTVVTAPPPPASHGRATESPVMRARRELRYRREHPRRPVASVLEEENRRIQQRIEEAGARGRDSKVLSPGTERNRRSLQSKKLRMSEIRADSLWEGEPGPAAAA